MFEHTPPEAIYKQYKARYGDILKAFSPEAFLVWLLDVKARRLYCNNSQVFQFQESNLPPASLDDWVARIHPEDLARLKDSWLAVIQGLEHGDGMENFYRVRCEGDEYAWFLSKGTVVARDDQGTAIYAVGIFIPVTILAEKIESATASQERAAFALEAARDGLWDWDVETGEVYYSPRYIAMLGYKPEEFPHTPESWRRHVHKDDLEKTVLSQLVHINSPERGDLFESIYRFLGADGSYRWILSRGKVVERDVNGRGKRIVGLHTDVTDLLLAQENLTRLVQHDSLTNLHSRLYFEQAFGKLSEEDYTVSIMYVDVDLLKAVNDSLGHEAGDKLLITAAGILRGVVRATDTIARIGGDEFALLMPRCSSHTANGVLRKVANILHQRNQDPETMPVFLSMGVAGTDSGVTLGNLLREADQAMFRQKSANRAESRARMQDWISRRKRRNGQKIPKKTD